MNEMAAIKKYLGISTTESELSHYTLIGLDQTATATEIKHALKKAIGAWNNSDKTSDPESAQHVAKLIKQAQAVLLDEVKKTEYDKMLAVKVGQANNVLFPQSDPFAPFDPSLYLAGVPNQQSPLSFGTIDERWDELSRQLQILDVPASETSFATNASATFLPERSVSVAAAKSGSAESASERIERLKRTRKQKQFLFLAAFSVLAIGFLGIAGSMFVLNRQQVAKQNEAKGSEDTGPMDSIKTKDTPPRTIGGKNAPKFSENESNFVLPTLSKEDSSKESPTLGIAIDNPLGVEPVRPTEPMKPAELMEPTPSNTVPPIAMNPDPPTTGMPAVVPQPVTVSKSEWVIAMKKAREAINKADFKTFSEQSELARTLATNDEMESKWARLDQMGQLYEIFIKAMHEAKTKMKGAETFSVGKTVFNIVEVKENELIVRRDGKNERYPWDRLPPGVANAMADFALSNSEPIDIAARAVYFSLSPAKNDLFAKRVKEWFEKSAGKGKVRQDLIQALTDTYE